MNKKPFKLFIKDIHNLYMPLSLLFDEEINKTGVKVWSYIKLVEIQEVICELTGEQLAELIGMHEDTVRKQLLKLESRGHIKRYRKEGTYLMITETVN